MPKRNRHREAVKSGQPAGMKLAAAPAARPTTAPGSTPSSAENAPVGATAKRKKEPPWVTTPPLTPEQRREKERARRKRIEARLRPQIPATLAALAERFPAVFSPDKPRPWAIGLFEELKTKNTGFTGQLLREALHRFTKMEAYQAALAAGGQRYDLDGNERGEVTDEQRRKASEKLEELRGRRPLREALSEG